MSNSKLLEITYLSGLQVCGSMENVINQFTCTEGGPTVKNLTWWRERGDLLNPSIVMHCC